MAHKAPEVQVLLLEYAAMRRKEGATHNDRDDAGPGLSEVDMGVIIFAC